MYLGMIVEQGASAEVFARPRHPYSVGLLSSVLLPNPRLRRQTSVSLRGEIPSPINLPTGCFLASRCPFADDHCRVSMPAAFGFADHVFLPESPSQGPFLELLTQSPQHGLALIRRLVDHAIAHYGGGAEPGSDAIVIAFPDEDRTFPWTRSYGWSRTTFSWSFWMRKAASAWVSWMYAFQSC